MSSHAMHVALNRTVPLTAHSAAGLQVERSALYEVHNRWLRLALLVACGVIALMALAGFKMAKTIATTRPVIVRVNELGEPHASTDDDNLSVYHPREAELKHFLINFVVDHYSRIRVTRRESFRRELFFLPAAVTRGMVEEEAKTHSIQAFLSSNDDEIEIKILSVAIEDLRSEPYKATVNFEEIHRSSGREIKREVSTAHLQVIAMAGVPDNFISVNPLGLIVTYFRADKAF